MSRSLLRRALSWLGISSTKASQRERQLRQRRFRRILQETLEDRRMLTGWVNLYTGSDAIEGDIAVNGFYISYSAAEDLNLSLNYTGSALHGAESAGGDFTAATGIMLPSGSSSGGVARDNS